MAAARAGLQAGKLRHKVTIQQRVSTQDSAGDIVSEWVDWARVWAAVEPMSAREFLTAQTLESKVTTRITVRYRAGLDATMRILHRGKIFNIQGVLADKWSGIEYQTLPCSEGTNTG